MLEITYVVQCLFLKDVDNNDPIRGDDEGRNEYAGADGNDEGPPSSVHRDEGSDEGPQSSEHQNDTNEQTKKVPYPSPQSPYVCLK